MKVAVIKNKPVVHFYKRQKAARVIATVDAEKAFYIGLDGEKIESHKMPDKPYEKQAGKAARFLIGLAKEVLPDNEVAYHRVETVRSIFRALTDKEPVKAFSDELKEKLISRSRMNGMEKRLKEAWFIPRTED